MDLRAEFVRNAGGLAKLIGTPAPYFVVKVDGTSVVFAGSHRSNGGKRVGRLRLPFVVVSPAQDLVVFIKATGVHSAGRDIG